MPYSCLNDALLPPCQRTRRWSGTLSYTLTKFTSAFARARARAHTHTHTHTPVVFWWPAARHALKFDISPPHTHTLPPPLPFLSPPPSQVAATRMLHAKKDSPEVCAGVCVCSV